MTDLRIVAAPTAFKGTLRAGEAAEAIVRAAESVFPHAPVVRLPLADGGDGTRDVLLESMGGQSYRRSVTGPLGRPLDARFAILKGGEALVEVAEASGLALVPPDERDPLLTTSRGTGELIREALESGASRILIGLGGSATVDGGIGMVSALGGRFLNSDGAEVAAGGRGLGHLVSIDLESMLEALASAEIIGLADVDNPLLGDRGAARVFGPQKGATREAVEILEAGLERHRDLALALRPDLAPDGPGDGAAGGLGFAIRFFLGGRLLSGASTILDAVKFDDVIRDADLVITGEGKVDHQSWGGKIVGKVLERCRKAAVPCWIIGGSVEDRSPPGDPSGVEIRALPSGRGGESPLEQQAVLREAVRSWLADWASER